MPRKPDPHIEERNRIICEDWLAGASKRDLANEHGLELQTIRKILRKANLREADRQVKPARQKGENATPLSKLHAKVGQRIAYGRVILLDMKLEDFAKKANVSQPRLRGIEAGTYSPSLLELQRISDLIKIPICKLTDPDAAITSVGG